MRAATPCEMRSVVVLLMGLTFCTIPRGCSWDEPVTLGLCQDNCCIRPCAPSPLYARTSLPSCGYSQQLLVHTSTTRSIHDLKFEKYSHLMHLPSNRVCQGSSVAAMGTVYFRLPRADKAGLHTLYGNRPAPACRRPLLCRTSNLEIVPPLKRLRPTQVTSVGRGLEPSWSWRSATDWPKKIQASVLPLARTHIIQFAAAIQVSMQIDSMLDTLRWYCVAYHGCFSNGSGCSLHSVSGCAPAAASRPTSYRSRSWRRHWPHGYARWMNSNLGCLGLVFAGMRKPCDLRQRNLTRRAPTFR
jgi:hypothetical protein